MACDICDDKHCINNKDSGLSYYDEYLKSGMFDIMPFMQFMEKKGTYYCEWCKRRIQAINIKEAAETDCAFVFLHDSEEHPCDAIFNIDCEVINSGTKAWADVTDSAQWVDDLRGSDD